MQVIKNANMGKRAVKLRYVISVLQKGICQFRSLVHVLTHTHTQKKAFKNKNVNKSQFTS